MFRKLISKLKCRKGQVGTEPATDPEVKSVDDQTDGQAQQAEKLEGLIQDIDLSDVPEEVRETVKKHLGSKVKQYDAGWRTKVKDVADERKELDQRKQELNNLVALEKEIEDDPELKSEITKLINNRRAGISPTKSEKADSVRTLDKLIGNAPDAETKESLRQLREIVKEETSELSGLKDKFEEIANQISTLRTATLTGQAERVDIVLGKLENEFGKEIVDKHKDQIRATALKMNSSNRDIRRLFYHYADEDDLETAFVNKHKTKQQKEQERKEQGSSAGGQGVKTPIKVEKDKFGRTNIKKLAQSIMERHKSAL